MHSRCRYVLIAILLAVLVAGFMATSGPPVPSLEGAFAFAAPGDAPDNPWEDIHYRLVVQDLTAQVPLETQLAARMDRYLAAQADTGFNGAVLVARDGRVILRKGYGWADGARTRRVTADTPFWIASISKQFAAAALLKLVELGRLSLTASIDRFFPNVPPDKRGITIHQLLTHTAGISQVYAADGIADRGAAVRAVLSQPLAHAPGGEVGYSNEAYTLVAAIVEITAGKPYEAFVKADLLGPAGLKSTGFWGPPAHPEVAATPTAAPTGAIAEPNWGYRGAVGMFSSAEDLYRWHLALTAHRVLSIESQRRLLGTHVQREETGVGYGWFITRTPRGTPCVWTRGYESFGHGAVLATYPSERVVIVVTSNSGERSAGTPVSHKTAEDLAALVFERQPDGV